MDIGHSREGGPESEGEGRSFIQGHSTPGAGEARKNKSHLELFGLFFFPPTQQSIVSIISSAQRISIICLYHTAAGDMWERLFLKSQSRFHCNSENYDDLSASWMGLKM